MSEIENLRGKVGKLLKLRATYHEAGDSADRHARTADTRRAQRRWQTINKATRAVGTAIEGSMLLGALIEKDMRARNVAVDKGAPVLGRFYDEAFALVDDLCFEASVIAALDPQPQTSTKPRRSPTDRRKK